MTKKRIALISGGYSGEAQISYQSATFVQQHLDVEQFEIFCIDITPHGWWYVVGNEKKILVNRADFSVPLAVDKTIHFDAAFICVHGTPGEDGKLQSYFDLIGLPYTSCNATTSAITMNKRYTLAVAAFAGIHVAKSMHLFKHNIPAIDTITNTLRMPLFVKPNSGGSSIGMSKVYQPEELQPALQKAFNEDAQVLVEEFISGREFTIGVFAMKEKVIALPITEVIPKNDFFDFEAKYQGKNEEITPAKINTTIQQQIETAATNLYHATNCSGVVRMDFIYNEEKAIPFLLEINTVPGQSTSSIIPQQVRAMGWSLQDFYTTLIENIL